MANVAPLPMLGRWPRVPPQLPPTPLHPPCLQASSPILVPFAQALWPLPVTPPPARRSSDCLCRLPHVLLSQASRAAQSSTAAARRPQVREASGALSVAPADESFDEDDAEELGASSHTFPLPVKVRTIVLPEEYQSKDDKDNIIEWTLGVATTRTSTSTNESMPLSRSINEGQLGNLKAVEALKKILLCLMHS